MSKKNDPSKEDKSGLRRKDVVLHSSQVQDFLQLLVERGVFGWRRGDSRGGEVSGLLTKANLQIRSGHLEEALQLVAEAELLLHDAYYKQSWWRRFFTRYQPHIFGYYLSLLFYLFVLGGGLNLIDDLPRFLLVSERMWGVPVKVLAFGAGGAILRGLYWLSTKVSTRQFRPHFRLAHFAAPWIGALFGGMVYVIVRAGLWTFQAADSNQIDQLWGILALAALAGYSWKSVMIWLKGVLENFFGRRSNRPASPSA